MDSSDAFSGFEVVSPVWAELPLRNMLVDTDLDPRLRAAFKDMPPPHAMPIPNSINAIKAFLGGLEKVMEQVFGASCEELPGANCATKMVDGANGSQRIDFFYPPGFSASSGVLYPCVTYYHGGGMAVLTVENALFRSTASRIAAHGVIIALVEFTASVVKPFPAGLEDCLAATEWIEANKTSLSISHQVIFGESGGANIAAAAPLLAKRRGFTGIKGVFLSSPFLQPESSNASHRQFNGYMFTSTVIGALSIVYTPATKDRVNPLAWAAFASSKDLEGYPATVIHIAEADILRDEGVNFGRKLQDAGVPVSASLRLGHAHISWQLSRIFPEEANAFGAEIAAFARRCGK